MLLSQCKQSYRQTAKVAKLSRRRRNFAFAIFSLVIISLLLLSKGVEAAVTVASHGYVSEVGILKQKSSYDFETAKAAFDDQEYYLSYRLFRHLAEAGHGYAQYFLATQYDTGLGVAKNAGQAFRWYKQAANAEIHVAQHNLAVAYAQGSGVEPDFQKAMRWWKHAAMRGNTDSQYNLGIIYISGKAHVKPDLNKAIRYWRMAAINGDEVAQFNLGALYANGVGMSSRTCEASRWWQKSAENGFEQAKVALAMLQSKKDYELCD